MPNPETVNTKPNTQGTYTVDRVVVHADPSHKPHSLNNKSHTLNANNSGAPQGTYTVDRLVVHADPHIAGREEPTMRASWPH